MGTLNRLGALALILSTSAAAQSPAAPPPSVEDFRAGKPHRLVAFADADHAFSEEKDRAGLLHEIERFLSEQLPTATAP